jgi:hypothetical protein
MRVIQDGLTAYDEDGNIVAEWDKGPSGSLNSKNETLMEKQFTDQLRKDGYELIDDLEEQWKLLCQIYDWQAQEISATEAAELTRYTTRHFRQKANEWRSKFYQGRPIARKSGATWLFNRQYIIDRVRK